MDNVKRSRKVGKAALLKSAPAYSWGKAAARPPIADSPGPGEYEPQDADRLRRGAAFGSSTRYQRPTEQTPSPLEYQQTDVTLKSAPGYTFRAKSVPDHLKSKTPGPGAYDPKVDPTKHDSPKISIKFRPEQTPESADSPAPNAYDPTKFRPKEVPAASMKYRHSMSSLNSGPSPLEYSDRVFQYHSTTPAKTFGTSRDYRHLDNGVPGPVYNADINAVRRAPKGVKVPNAAARPNPENGVPGPGTYFEEAVCDYDAGHGITSENRSAPSVSVGGRPYVPGITETPGPTEYGVPPVPGAKSPPKYSFRGVDAIDPLKKNPGPGAYNPDKADKVVRASAPAISVAFKSDDPALKEQKPGPNEYSPRLESKTAVSIKSRKGWEQLNKDCGPSPAEYDLVKVYCPPGSRKGYTFGQKPKAKQMDGTPGPIYEVGCTTLGVAAAQPATPAEMSRIAVL